mmetsp:Transcript_8259/g.27478  ORF Transcript_8259/g.27478 Transcript_8259/m.27478 type:complete len:225 (+) Transcript_8259:611-1285(+)
MKPGYQTLSSSVFRIVNSFSMSNPHPIQVCGTKWLNHESRARCTRCLVKASLENARSSQSTNFPKSGEAHISLLVQSWLIFANASLRSSGGSQNMLGRYFATFPHSQLGGFPWHSILFANPLYSRSRGSLVTRYRSALLTSPTSTAFPAGGHGTVRASCAAATGSYPWLYLARTRASRLPPCGAASTSAPLYPARSSKPRLVLHTLGDRHTTLVFPACAPAGAT